MSEPMSDARLAALVQIAAHAESCNLFSPDPEERWEARIEPGHLTEAVQEIHRLRLEAEKRSDWNLRLTQEIGRLKQLEALVLNAEYIWGDYETERAIAEWREVRIAQEAAGRGGTEER